MARAVIMKGTNKSFTVHMLSASRHLERIADLATDISEEVIYMVKGEIIRHRMEDFKAQRLKR
ncbi:MAG: hypothetical protein HWN71_02500 [Desulfobacterales bacterium]|nr:hypothetical protein [Desulfobacterales bacterium]